jgi:dCTP deaminase
LCVIGEDEFLKLQSKHRVFYPFNEALLDGDGYVLTVKEDVTMNYLEHHNLLSNEVVFVPPSYVAHLTAKSIFGRMGLSFLNAAKVHSGYVGRLVLEAVNLNNARKPITIRKSDPFCHFELDSRLGAPAPYSGRYNFQYMTDEEVETYIQMMCREFPDLYDAKKLRLEAESRVMTPAQVSF